ncbi:DUF2115 domain-containing protein [Methanothermococcus okinawensis]|uniref:UPF0305 protein Metok_1091 n=1 Tax=Methanothermococcus okinawensis (strain DSM 14208 / JCM 11175 / IH1) TaxID=647113 RepID=F8ANK7_METOI|nr:DUF2115 domain-containing protein [Methanothermococcus okinawensis]AEH07061.1 Protein of unknown function DUF2115 [Methanothermococcus okinawensis IH1]
MKSKELLKKLKEDASKFSIHDLMNVRLFLEKDMEYLPKEYKESYLKDQIIYFINTLKELRKKNEEELEDFEIDEDILNKLYNRINQFKTNTKGEDSFIKLSHIVTPYLIFIAKKPLHPIGMRFPGGKRIIEKNGIYYCPVKNRQKNEYSLCEFCICKGIEELKNNNK